MKRQGLALTLFASVLAGCSPLYLWDTSTTVTRGPRPFDVAELAREPVATLGPLTPVGLQGFAPFLSHSLDAVLSQASPAIRGTPPRETLNRLNDQGLGAEYTDLIADFGRSGILERDRLRRIGSALGARHVLLPGLAEFSHVLADQFELSGIKLIRNRIITLRLWLQLWDAQTGHLLWESTGEALVASQIVAPQRSVPLDLVAQRLWRRMVQDLLGEPGASGPSSRGEPAPAGSDQLQRPRLG